MKKIMYLLGLLLYLITSTCTGNNLTTPDSNSKTSLKQIHLFLDNSVCIKKEKVCYIIDTSGISEINLVSNTVRNIDNVYFSDAGVKLNAIYANNNQLLYLGTNKGIYIGKKQITGNYLFEHITAFGLEEINKIYVDLKQTIFAGTNGNGLIIGERHPYTNNNYIISHHYLPFYYIQYIYIGTQDTIFVGSNKQHSPKSNMLWIKEITREYSLQLPNDEHINTINDTNGFLKIGTDHGLLIAGNKSATGSYQIPSEFTLIFSMDNEKVDAPIYITPTGKIYAHINEVFFKVIKDNNLYKIMTHVDTHRQDTAAEDQDTIPLWVRASVASFIFFGNLILCCIS